MTKAEEELLRERVVSLERTLHFTQVVFNSAVAALQEAEADRIEERRRARRWRLYAARLRQRSEPRTAWTYEP